MLGTLRARQGLSSPLGGEGVRHGFGPQKPGKWQVGRDVPALQETPGGEMCQGPPDMGLPPATLSSRQGCVVGDVRQTEDPSSASQLVSADSDRGWVRSERV